MRFLYIDEAGTSEHEPATVVAGIIVHADREWREIANYLQFVKTHFVPEELRDGFIFHAKELFSGTKATRGIWSLAERLEVLRMVAEIPKRFSLPVAFAYCLKPKNTNASGRHLATFALCLKRGNDYIKEFCPDEVATAVVEDVPHMRTLLGTIPGFLSSTEAAKLIRFSNFAYDAIVDQPHFTPKNSAPILQVADHIAFILRRFYAKQPHGEQLIRHLVSDRIADRIRPSVDTVAGSGVLSAGDQE